MIFRIGCCGNNTLVFSVKYCPADCFPALFISAGINSVTAKYPYNMITAIPCNYIFCQQNSLIIRKIITRD